jgi:hypothetical protein
LTAEKTVKKDVYSPKRKTEMPNAEKRNEDNFESDKKEENKDSIDVPSKYIATPNTG